MLESKAEAAPLAGSPDRGPPSVPVPRESIGSTGTWIRALVAAHFDFVWRSLRRLGVPEADVDDAAQKVFCVALRRTVDVAVGSERAFLFGTAMNIAADVRRTRARAREVVDDEVVRNAIDPASDPEELVVQKCARRMLDDVLDAMEIDLRAVFVLVELEELTAPEVATLLDLPVGTVASRLRRARQQFHARVERIRASTARVGRLDSSGDGVRGGKR